jgi:hypothetical protein
MYLCAKKFIMKIQTKILLLLFLSISLFVNGQDSRLPILNVRSGNADVYLQSLDIQVEVIGNVASTRFVMVFKNRTNRLLEGELIFPLPDGVTVSHYGLDINGKMRDAVPVEKAMATQVFEEIVHRRVDPGLLERVEGNNFRTRIYPIWQQGIRTISIGYEEELTAESDKFWYRLPMAYSENIENFSLKATVHRTSSKPTVEGAMANQITFDTHTEAFIANFSRTNYLPPNELIFSLPQPIDIPQVLVQSASGSFYFTVSCIPNAETRRKTWGNRIGIIWDCSLSGLQRNHSKELDLLDKIIKQKRSCTIELYLLNNTLSRSTVFNISNGNWSELRKALNEVIYDGGTNFAAIDLSRSRATEFLFFSDGLSTLSESDIVSMKPALAARPIHCITSSARADYSSMRWIAVQTAGKFINLNALSDTQIEQEIMFETLQFLGIENNNHVNNVYPSISTPVTGNFSIAGILTTSQTELVLRFGFGNQTTQRIRVRLNTNEARTQANIYRLWAQKKIAQLDMQYEENKLLLTALGQQFGIVTRNTSLLVLETLQDYVRYNIIPPQELQEEYFRVKRNQNNNNQRNTTNFINAAKSIAADLNRWWNTSFTPKPQAFPQPDNVRQAAASTASSRRQVTHIDEEEHHVQSSMHVEHRVTDAVSDVDELVVTAFGVASQRSSADMATSRSVTSNTQPIISVVALNQDASYVSEFTGKLEDDYATYLRLRPQYVSTPDFYFFVADWFFRKGDRHKAIQILTSIADLDIENASLYRLLGYRFKEYKEFDLQLYVCKKVIQWRPFEPQTYRDYALALSDAGQHQAALDSLYATLTRFYPNNIFDRSRGIEESIIMEINRLASKHKLNITSIPSEIIYDMPVDIRVVINWNMDNTDIDLHVVDPSGEECYYSNTRTAAGGRISRDITRGYGPEQFLLKKATKGKYRLYVNYFGDTQVKAEGPSTIMAEIYLHYFGKAEQRQVICLQLIGKETDRGGKLLFAEFEF